MNICTIFDEELNHLNTPNRKDQPVNLVVTESSSLEYLSHFGDIPGLKSDERLIELFAHLRRHIPGALRDLV